MSRNSRARTTLSPTGLSLLALLLVQGGCRAGAGGGADLDEEETPRGTAATADAASPNLVSLPPDVYHNANLATAVAAARPPVETLTVPATVEHDPQRTQEVTSLVAGRVERVEAAAGDRVRRDAPLATLISAEVADDQERLIAAEGRLRLAQAGRKRTAKLVEIGAAAGKELQAAEAEVQSTTAEVRHLREALASFGAGAAGGTAGRVTLLAPIDGVVTERLVNPGSGVQPGQELLRLADQRTVWVIARIGQAQLERLRPDAVAEIRSAALPTGLLAASVDYIDPNLDPATHTAPVRLVVVNPGEALRAGMYVEVSLRLEPPPGAASHPWIPEPAVDHLGERTVVYVPVAEEPGTFRVRDVEVGAPSGGGVPVLAGLEPGETVVTQGTFALKSRLLQGQLEDDD